MLNLKQLVKDRIEEAKKSYKENKEFKKKIYAKIKVAKREAFEKQIEVEAKKSGAAAAKRHFAPTQPVAVGMFSKELKKKVKKRIAPKPAVSPITVIFSPNQVGNYPVRRKKSKPKPRQQKPQPQRPFDPFRDLPQ